MKLIDLLVQELPKRGGWPESADRIHQDHDGEIYAWTASSCVLRFRSGIIADNCRPYGLDESIENMVTRDQYEKALAASQKQAWDGEGLPPVGCECVVTPHNTAWGFSSVDNYTGRVLAYDGEDFWFAMLGGVKVTSRTDKVDFRPIKSEADKKRDAAIEAILSDMRTIPCDLSLRDEVAVIYDAIAAGKIPGVKLED